MLSYEYIRGLVEGEGSFSFCTVPKHIKDGLVIKEKLPAFTLAMSVRDKELVGLVRDALDLKNKVYEYAPRKNKGSHNRQGMAILIVRDLYQLKNIIVPLFYSRLHGHKKRQFEEWIERIGLDLKVPGGYKMIYALYKTGYYENKLKQFE